MGWSAFCSNYFINRACVLLATSKVIIDNIKTRVTEWSFVPGAETGWHRHEYDYVVVPMLDGQLKMILGKNNDTTSELKKGSSYFRNAGVEHNVININKYNYSFIEIEFK